MPYYNTESFGNHFYKTFRSIKSLFINYPLNVIEKNSNNKISLAIKNLKLKLTNKKNRFQYDKKLNLFFVTEDSYKHYFGNRSRGYFLYTKGLKRRGESLAECYCLMHIKFKEDDLVIDCGANYADLWIYLKDKINKKNYITFEPGLEEHKCIKKNSKDGDHYNFGLGNKEEISSLYQSSEGGDNSFLRPNVFTDIIPTKIITLEKWIERNNIKKIKLFKIEAEGYEPEVLEGAKNVLKIIEYIAVDGGEERFNCETMSDIANLLIAENFKMIEIKFNSRNALFRNSNFN
tara:strand:+ start:43 stop:912 length:870 start_codon:yes stop_codon:yes gene_type:complete